MIPEDMPSVGIEVLPHAEGLGTLSTMTSGSAGYDLGAAIDGELVSSPARCGPCPRGSGSRSLPGLKRRCGPAAAWRSGNGSACSTARARSTATTAARSRCCSSTSASGRSGLPFLFERTGSDCVCELHRTLTQRRQIAEGRREQKRA